MKTKYQTPEIEVRQLCTEDVIATSTGTSTPGLGTGGTYEGGSSQQWGDLWS